MTDACFTYGSLMCDDIMAKVTDQAVHGEPAVLAGYVRHPVRDETYPGMVPDADAHVAGVLYRGLSAKALERLDRFEGEMYDRREVVVRDTSGAETTAWTYVFRPEFGHLLLLGDWDFDAFLAEGKARFESLYMGFDNLG